ncbi:MAG: formate--tetrahydrofolate ligase [Caldisericaceae bacterium]
MNDYEISKNAKLQPIEKIAERLNLPLESLTLYGKYVAKVDHRLLKSIDRTKGKLIFVSAMTPTPYGEGKTTTTIGLTDALNLVGYKAIGVLRQPSLGPIFGVKGGATGGGFAQVAPIEDINFLFTGDFPAVEYANNLLSALIDNNLHQGNPLNLDPKRIKFSRVMDMNERALRDIIIGLGEGNGVIREEHFKITTASEIMAILGLSFDIEELKKRLSNIFVGFTYDKQPVFARDLKGVGAMAVILRNAINPNLVQTLENNPVFVHTGPFANIAHGTASVISISLAQQYADYVVVEGGFGTDLGGEKFMDIVSRIGNFEVSLVVIVASIRALKYHGGQKLGEEIENLEAISKGFENLKKHIENMQSFGLNVVVAINKFYKDTEKEINLLKSLLDKAGVKFALSEVYERGGLGGEELAKIVAEIASPTKPKFLYELNEPVKEKIYKIATTMYGAKDVVYSDTAEKDLKDIAKINLDNTFICMAKTQTSLTDNPKIVGRKENFLVTVNEVRALAGANFIVPILGSINTMPGLPKEPIANRLNIDNDGVISGF